MAGHPSSSSALLSCAEDGCVKVFSNYEELKHHLDAESHLFIDAQYKRSTNRELSGGRLRQSKSLPGCQTTSGAN